MSKSDKKFYKVVCRQCGNSGDHENPLGLRAKCNRCGNEWQVKEFDMISPPIGIHPNELFK